MAVGHDALGSDVFAIVFKNPKAGDEPPKTGRRPDVTISNQIYILPQRRGISSSAFSAREFEFSVEPGSPSNLRIRASTSVGSPLSTSFELFSAILRPRLAFCYSRFLHSQRVTRLANPTAANALSGYPLQTRMGIYFQVLARGRQPKRLVQFVGAKDAI